MLLCKRVFITLLFEFKETYNKEICEQEVINIIEIEVYVAEEEEGGGEEEENLLDMIRGNIAGVVTSHHGLHLHQVLLHIFCYFI